MNYKISIGPRSMCLGSQEAVERKNDEGRKASAVETEDPLYLHFIATS